MASFTFTFELGNGTGDGVCFAELDGIAEVFDDATIEARLFDFNSVEYVNAPEYLLPMIDLFLRDRYSPKFHQALDEARRDGFARARRIAHAAE